ncbi:hypothetical protein BD770DRAFT_381499 [Pilaira anomala]|nr:hypothetical protein BD770DRAFT_381499 [Pilaira anomala]
MTNNITTSNNTNTEDVSNMSDSAMIRRIYQITTRLERKFDAQFAPATRRANFGAMNATTEIDRVARQNEMARVNAIPNYMGTRNIAATLPEARIGFQATGTNRTPSATARIDALISFLLKSRAGSAEEISPNVIKTHRLRLRSLTRLVRGQMIMQGVTATSWSELSATEQLYFSLRLEEEVNEGLQLPIYRCNKQWAARLLLQDKMKGERQCKKRREERTTDLAEAQPVVNARVKLEDFS